MSPEEIGQNKQPSISVVYIKNKYIFTTELEEQLVEYVAKASDIYHGLTYLVYLLTWYTYLLGILTYLVYLLTWYTYLLGILTYLVYLLT